MNLFHKKRDNLLKLIIPIEGQIVDITEVPDITFSEKYIGDGVAIYPTDGKLHSPADGEIVFITETCHAIGIRTKENFDILIHLGLETVAMGGEGFECLVKVGNKVKTGQLLINFNLELVKQKAKSTVSPILIANMDTVKQIEKNSLLGDDNILMTVMKA